MPVTTAIFISRIQGLPVLDGTGDQVGKVRDVVVATPAANRPTRVKGLVVELFGRRRIFMPMIRVRSVDAQQIAIGGALDTRKFQRRSSETLVVDDLFDMALPKPGGGSEVLFDVAMREVGRLEWQLTEAAIRDGGGLFKLGGKGQTRTVPWREVAARLARGAQGTELKLAELAEMNPADVARELHEMSPARRIEIARALDDQQLADAFQELPEDEQVTLLNALDAERAADVLEEMDPDDAADLISDLPAAVAEDLLGRMEPEEAADVRTLLTYDELTAGGMMTPEPVMLAPDGTVADALARLRNEEVTPALASMIFICRPPLDTPSGKYLGAVHIQRLLREPPSLMAATMMDDDLEPLPPDADLFKVSRFFATYNLVVAPVVNPAGQLVGAVTVDDLIDHMLPEDWRGEQLDD
jgi:CBS domain-containing protein/sporulation protein YlmC with PRC-barrel domain